MIAGAVAVACRLVSGPSVQWRCDPYDDRPRIYFSNHSSHLDFIVIWSALPPAQRRFVRPVAGRDYWERSALRRYFARHVFGAVLIDRASPEHASAPAAARDAIQRMADGMGARFSLIVFPEGTRSPDGEVGRFKSGLFHLSQLRPDAELIPVHLENLNRILPKGEVVPVPMLSRIVFGTPLLPVPNEGKREFLARARDTLIELTTRQ